MTSTLLVFVLVRSSAYKMDICYSHPAIHSQMLETNTAGYSYPSNHISLQAWAMGLPGFHPLVDEDDDHDNVDDILREGDQYEDDHPNIDQYVNRLSAGAACHDFSGTTYPPAGVCPASVSSTHPAIDAAIQNSGVVYPASHIKTHPLLASWMPSTHRSPPPFLQKHFLCLFLWLTPL
jgi:hypothetical protein